MLVVVVVVEVPVVAEELVVARLVAAEPAVVAELVVAGHEGRAVFAVVGSTAEVSVAEFVVVANAEAVAAQLLESPDSAVRGFR